MVDHVITKNLKFWLTLYNFEEADLLLFTTFRKNLRFGEAERALMQ